MIKAKTCIFKSSLLLSITLSVIISSCNGQTSKSSPQNKLLSQKALSQDSALENTPSNKQINQVVRTIFQDSKGDIWFGTENGAFRLRGKLLTHIDGIKSESGKGVTIKDITEDKDGKIWLGHTDGISSIDKDIVKNYYVSDGLISNDVWCITADSAANIWIGTIDGVCIFDGQKFSNFHLPKGEIDTTVGISSPTIVHSIMKDSHGTLWFSSNAGLFSYSNNELINVAAKVGIQTNFVNEIIEDNKGGYWISTKEDLYNLKENKLINITKDKIEIGKGIGSVSEDGHGNIWFVSNQHHLYTFDKKELKKYHKTDDNKGPVIFQIFNDQRDRLWFVGYGGAYRLENGKFINITKAGPW